MSLHETLMPMVHDRVDALLGRTITYTITGAGPLEVQGFIFLDEDLGATGLDGLRSPPRVKIRASFFGAGRPKQSDRLTCVSRLGAGVWCPTVGLPVQTGEYFIFDIQKV